MSRQINNVFVSATTSSQHQKKPPQTNKCVTRIYGVIGWDTFVNIVFDDISFGFIWLLVLWISIGLSFLVKGSQKVKIVWEKMIKPVTLD